VRRAAAVDVTHRAIIAVKEGCGGWQAPVDLRLNLSRFQQAVAALFSPQRVNPVNHPFHGLALPHC
jgi:hypothetical protein